MNAIEAGSEREDELLRIMAAKSMAHEAAKGTGMPRKRSDVNRKSHAKPCVIAGNRWFRRLHVKTFPAV